MTQQPKPATFLNRAIATTGRIAKRLLESAAADRLTGNWGTHPFTADEVVRRHQRTLVARSRDQAINNDYARKFLQMCRQNIVGPRGVQLQAQARDADGTLDAAANEAIETVWRMWGRPENCDVTGRHSFRQIQAEAVDSAARDGEFFIRLVQGAQAGPYGFALQMIDAQRCRPDYDQENPRTGNFVRHGIEFNEYGRPIAYYFTTLKPKKDDEAYTYGGQSHVRIPAEEIIHGFMPDMISQKRGLPWMATALSRLKMLGNYEEAALVNANISASKGGFFKWDPDYAPDSDEDRKDEPLYMDVEPGSFQELRPGQSFEPWNPQYPNGEFAHFHKAILRGIASGLGVTYVNLANDLEGVNFSSIRQGALDEREHWKELQEWLIESLIDRVYGAWLPRMLAQGRIRVPGRGGVEVSLPLERIDKFRAVEWQPRRWDWIDPNADVKAAIASKNNLLASPGQIIRDRGRDPESVWQEIGRDIDAMRRAGIPDRFIDIALGTSTASPAENEEGAKAEVGK